MKTAAALSCVGCNPLMEPMYQKGTGCLTGYFVKSKQYDAVLHTDIPVSIKEKEDIEIYCNSCGRTHEIYQILKIKYFFESLRGYEVRVKLTMKVEKSDIVKMLEGNLLYDDLGIEREPSLF